MATETILVNFKARGDQKLIKSMHALAQAQGRLEKNSKSAAKNGLEPLGTAFKRNAANSSKMSLAMSTLRSKLLLATFAFGGIIAASTRFTKAAAKVQQMELAFSNLVGSSESASISMEKLRIATNGTMSQIDLLKQANNAMILGVTRNTDEMAKMFDMAQRLGKALGVDTNRAVESLVTGIGRQSRLMLDNIGIIVKSDEAYKKYAFELGKTVDALTDSEKKQAFLNATLEAAENKLKSVGDEEDSNLDKMQRLGASAENFGTKIGEALLPSLADLADGLSVVLDRGSDFLEWSGLVDSALDKSIEALNNEQVATLGLQQELKGVTEGSEEFLKIRDTIVAKFPNYFKNIEEEKIGIELLTQSLKDHNAFLIQQIKLEMVRDTLNEKQEQLTKVVSVLSERRLKQRQLENKLRNESLPLIEAEADKLKLVGEERKEFVAGVQDILEKQDMFKVSFSETSDEVFAFTGTLAKGIANSTIFSKGILEVSKSYDRYNESLGATIKSEEEVQAIISELTEEFNLQKEVVQELIDEIFGEFGDAFDKIDFGSVAEDVAKMSDEVSQAEKDINSIAQATTSFWLSSQQGARTFKAFGDVVVQQIERILATFLANFATFKLMGLFFGGNFTQFAKAPTLFGQTMQQLLGQGSTVGAMHGPGFSGIPFKHNGGMIQSYHKGGNVPIMAQEGEFVMQRSAVESIGIENLSRMNTTGQSGVNINFTGNVLSKNFIESEAIPMIKKAIRKGATLGKA